MLDIHAAIVFAVGVIAGFELWIETRDEAVMIHNAYF